MMYRHVLLVIGLDWW